MFQPEGLENGSVINNYGQSSLKMHSNLQHPCSDHQKTSTSCWPAFMAVGCEFIKQQLWAGSHGCNSEKLALDWNRWMVPLHALIHFEEASETHDVVGCFSRYPFLWKVKREKEDLDIYGCHFNKLAPSSDFVLFQRISTHRTSDIGSLAQPKSLFPELWMLCKHSSSSGPALNYFSSFPSSKREDRFCIIPVLT